MAAEHRLSPSVDGADAASAAALWRPLVDGFAEAVVVCDARHVVRHVNRLAETYLPAVRVGRPAGAAGLPLPADTGPADLRHDGRVLRLRRVDFGTAGYAWYLRDVTGELVEHDRTAFLARCAQRLGRLLHVGHTARTVVDLAVPTLAGSAVLLVPTANGRVDWWRAGGDGPTTAGATTTGELSAPVARALAFPAPPRTVRLTGAEERLAGSAGEALLVGLAGIDRPAGVLLLCQPADGGDRLLAEYADRCGLALTAAQMYAEQSSVAATLQGGLMPARLPVLPGIGLGAAYRAGQRASRIGGDFYEVYRLADDDVLFVLGDVCGKGVEAAVLTGQVRHSLQALHRVERDPARLLRLLNETMLEAARSGPDAVLFATMVLGRARRTPDGLDVELADAGHLPPLVYRRDGSVETLMLRGVAVGVSPRATFAGQRIRLAEGETLMLVSDGVTEARGGRGGRELYGQDRLVEAFGRCAGMPAGAISERIDMLVNEWTVGDQHDDVAVLCVQAGGGR